MKDLEGGSDKVADALVELKTIRTEVAVMGANNSEIPEIDELIRKVEVGEITPEEALKQAHTIKNIKQDYH